MTLERHDYFGCFGILHFGDIEVTKRCVDNLFQLNQIEDCLILILDNDLRKNAKEDFLRLYKSMHNVQVLKTEEKCGFSKANNYLYEQCMPYNFRFIALLNNDIEIHQKNFIDNLMAIVNLDKYFIIGPDVYKPSTHEHQSPLALYYPGVESINNNLMHMCREMLKSDDVINHFIRQKKVIGLAHKFFPDFIFTLYRTVSHKTIVPLNYRQSYEDCILSGACLIFTNKFINEESLPFYPETEFYFEEMILGLRCKMKGYKTLFTPKLKVYHKHSASSLQNVKSLIDYEKTVANRMVASFEVLKKYEETNYFKSELSNENNQSNKSKN